MARTLSRRTFVGAAIAAGGLAAAGCGAAQRDAAGNAEAVNATSGAGGSGTARPRLAAMTVYRDPSCGCCEAWSEIARRAGYQVRLIDHADMPAIKRQYGVPEDLASCHTALVAGYVIEGHVPLDDVDHLLDERPSRIRGLAVPGMPRGSPGMEVPDGAKDPFQVLAFDAAGKSSLFHS